MQLPMDEHQRFRHFKQMMFTYSRLLISEEDYYKSSKPKKMLFGFFTCYGSVGLSIWVVKQQNPETYYKKILLSPIIIPLMVITPILASYLFVMKHRQVQQDIY